MNEFLPSRFVESVKRLALGLEPIDAALRLRPSYPIDVTFDVAPLGLPRPAIDHHRTGLHVLLYSAALTSPVDLRLVDHARRYVPRRLRIPILTKAAADAAPAARRVRRPVMFPGAAYDVADATGVRGRVVRGGQAMRWARVVARLPGAGPVVGRAHGDDRGEFLLLIGAEAGPVGDLESAIEAGRHRIRAGERASADHARPSRDRSAVGSAAGAGGAAGRSGSGLERRNATGRLHGQHDAAAGSRLRQHSQRGDVHDRMMRRPFRRSR